MFIESVEREEREQWVEVEWLGGWNDTFSWVLGSRRLHGWGVCSYLTCGLWRIVKSGHYLAFFILPRVSRRRWRFESHDSCLFPTRHNLASMCLIFFVSCQGKTR